MATNTRAEQALRKTLKSLRLEYGLTQLELAERLGCAQTVISRIESGDRRLYATQLFEIVEDGFGMTPAQFIKRYQRNL